MTIGFGKDLYVLPFDHRATFKTKMFGWTGEITQEQIAQIAAAKQVIYDAFKAAVAAGVPRERAGILVDETYGDAILRQAAKDGFMTACPAEKSGRDEFDFEYGEDFARHIEAFKPTFCKVLVRYNPEGDRALNQRQAARLKLLSDYLHSKGRSLYMFELLVPAEKAQMERLKGDKRAYDVEVRPRLMVQAIPLDELFEAATLVQCGKIGPFPLILVGREFWRGMRDFLLFMVDQGVFGADEVGFGRITDSADEAVDFVLRSLPDALRKRLKTIKGKRATRTA